MCFLRTHFVIFPVFCHFFEIASLTDRPYNIRATDFDSESCPLASPANNNTHLLSLNQASLKRQFKLTSSNHCTTTHLVNKLEHCFVHIGGQMQKVAGHPQREEAKSCNWYRTFFSLREGRILWRRHKCGRFAKAVLDFAVRDVIPIPVPSLVVNKLPEVLKSIDCLQLFTARYDYRYGLLPVPHFED